jgi:PAS domain S-box-containing protein
MSQAHSSVIGSPARLEALRRLKLLDSAAEPAFDRLAQLAARILKAPVALISLVDDQRQFFKSVVGLSEPWATLRETPLSHSFCQHVVASGAPLIIDDARTHPLVQYNLAIRDLNIIAYAGIPLITHEGFVLGSLCAIDSVPRGWTDDEIAMLSDLGGAVMTEIELRAEIIERKQAEDTARQLAEQRKRLLEVAQTVVSSLTLDEILPKLQRTFREILEHDGLSVYWVDQEAGVLRPAHTTRPIWLSDTVSGWSIPLDSGITGAVGRSGRAELVNNAHLDPRSIYPPGTASIQPHHMICVPIRSNHHVRGIFIVSRNNGLPFTEQDFQLVQLFVSFVALAIENARLFEQTRESQERFSKIFHASPVASTITSLATEQILEVNQAFVDLMGYSREQVVGHKASDLATWADSNDRERVLRLLQEQLSVRSLELTVRTKSGTLLETLASMEIVELDGERCILSLTQDISSYKRAEAALAEQHSFRAAIIERAAEGLCVCHTVDEFPYVAFTIWNDRMIEITGYTLEAINTRGWYQSLYPDPEVQARAIERMGRMRYGEDLLAEEWEIVRADGARRVVTISTSVLTSGDGAAHVLALIHDITDRKRAEEALRESEERFAKAFRASPVASCITTLAEGRYLDVNDSFVRLLGYTREEAIGRTSMDLQLWANSSDRARVAQYLLEHGAIYDFESRTRTKSGELRDTLTSLELIDIAGERCILTLFHDITERRRAEEALRESEERFRRLSEVSFEGIAIHDHGIILDANVAQSILLGYEPGEVIGMNVLDFATPESREVILRHIREGDDGPYEVSGMRKDGTTMPIEVQARPFTYQGRAVRVAATRDITERKRAEEALRASEERFRTLIRDLQVGVLLQGPDAEIILSNRAALDLLGLTEEELLGKSSLDPNWSVIHEDGSPFPGPDHPVPQAIATRQPVRNVIMGVFRPRTGDRVWLLVNAEPQLNDNGSLRHVICSFADITDRKRAEQEQRRLIHELQEAITNVKTLRGLLPICSSCKKIRDDHGYWNQIETYIKTHSEANFTHGICPECMQRLYGDLYDE